MAIGHSPQGDDRTHVEEPLAQGEGTKLAPGALHRAGMQPEAVGGEGARGEKGRQTSPTMAEDPQAEPR